MWQITWMLSLLPDWFWTLVLIAGIIGILAAWLLRKIPFVMSYSLPIKIGSVFLLLLGVYFQGVIANEEKWQAEMKKLEEQVRVAEAQSAEANGKLATEIDAKKQLAAQKNKEVIKYIDRWNTKEVVKEIPGPERIKEITKDMSAEQKKAYEAEIAQLKQNQGRVQEVIKYIESCPVPKEMIDIHNEAARLNRAATPPAKKEEAKK